MTTAEKRSAPFHYGWIILATAVGTSFASVTFFNPVLGAFTSSLETEFGWSRAEVPLAIALGSLVGGIISPLSGALIDKWGARWIIFIAGVGMLLACLGLSFISSLWQLVLLYGLGRALAMSGMQPGSYVTIANWFIQKRAFAASIVGLGQRIGMATLPPIVLLTIDITGSWEQAWLILCVLLGLSFLPAVIFTRRRPEDVGLLPDGVHKESHNLEGRPTSESAGSQTDTLTEQLAITLRAALRMRSYWLVGAALSLTMMTSGAINFHQIQCLVENGLNAKETGLVMLTWAATGAVGAIVGGFIAQRITMRKTMIVSLLLMSVTIQLLGRSDTITTGLIYAVTNGIAFGSHVTFMQVIHADYFGRLHVGKIRGSMQPIQLGMNAIGPVLVGIWYDHYQHYDGIFIFFSAIFLIAAGAYYFAQYPTLTRRRS